MTMMIVLSIYWVLCVFICSSTFPLSVVAVSLLLFQTSRSYGFINNELNWKTVQTLTGAQHSEYHNHCTYHRQNNLEI